MPEITPLRQALNHYALVALRALARGKNLLLKAAKPLAPAVSASGRFIARWIILPIYRSVLMLRLRLGRFALSVRGIVFLVFTHRFVLHGVVAAVCVVTIASQLQARQANAFESGRSLLYALVTDGEDAVIEEDARPELARKDSNYLGSETIIADLGVDYDYDEADDIQADLTVPGSIALLPGAEDQGIPGDVQIQRTTTETYVIQPGDVISTIASRYGVTVGTILWANGLNQRSYIQPGDKIKIPPVSGVLHKVKKGDTLTKLAATYKSNLDEILTVNRLAPGASITPGDELVIPGGTPPAVATPRPVAINSSIRPDVPLSRIRNKALDVYQEITGKNDARPKPEDLPEGTIAKGKLLWPTHLRVINQYYGWKHTGVDIDGDYVDAIYASEDGVVEKAGWNSGGYGLMILIDHGSNNKTRYGHASKLFVKAGDTVKRGQVIAMVGTTGRSTGTHLHYEVYIHGKRVNPLAYIK